MRCRRARMPSLCMKRTSSSGRWIAEGAKDDSPVGSVSGYTMDNPPTYAMPPVVTSMDFSPDGTSLAVTGFHEALIHKADGSGLLARLVGLSERIESVCFSPDGKKLGITGGQPGRMGRCRFGISRPGSSNCPRRSPSIRYTAALGLPDGKYFAFGAADTSIRNRCFDWKTGCLYGGS